ncbi:MAG TPA: dienelactone hydrolase family protein [Candidatus Micrarchaeaceae archaeon]|nr:dienelactone hydrolase family protein [Candidatus Micrarchaeaceae archaeon]
MKQGLRLMLAILAAVLCGGAWAAPSGPVEVKTETVQIPTTKGTIDGYLARPAGNGKFPAILLIHEWWGLNDWIKEEAQKFAEQGYVALAVDLYRGQVATDAETAHELMRGVPQDLAVDDMKSAHAYLAKRDDVVKEHIGVVGWCWGGGQALELAIHDQQLAAVVVNYGALPTDPNQLQQIVAPVLGNFGAEDKGITPSDVHDFEKAMKNLKRYVDVKIYEGAGHAFENPNNASGYRPEAAADAWQRTLNFFNKTLH